MKYTLRFFIVYLSIALVLCGLKVRKNKDDVIDSSSQKDLEDIDLESSEDNKNVDLKNLVVEDTDPKVQKMKILREYFPEEENSTKKISRIQLKEILLKYYDGKDLKTLLRLRSQNNINRHDAKDLSTIEQFMTKYVPHDTFSFNYTNVHKFLDYNQFETHRLTAHNGRIRKLSDKMESAEKRHDTQKRHKIKHLGHEPEYHDEDL